MTNTSKTTTRKPRDVTPVPFS